MTTRRHFIKSLVALPPTLAMSPLWAATDAARVALVIGNAAYSQAPLQNPVNDADAMAGLLGSAGFLVDKRTDVTQQGMLSAIEQFGEAVRRSETRLAIFYYAGHGAQLDWRNYLLPVDARVENAGQLKQRCVDLGILLGKLAGTKNKTFIIILDACRNNPFGNAYRPEQKGLSQFDAPVNSLLAYATSPGNVAADGTGSNGLYTENLIQELGNQSARIEDALKRVRLRVRLASDGAQIPWESTSLEGDVFIFPALQKKLSDAEIEAQLEAKLAEWARIKNSSKPEDWTGYLLRFPNGRFAEIAQVRLNRLLSQTDKEMPAVAASTGNTAEPAELPAKAASPGDEFPGELTPQPSSEPDGLGRPLIEIVEGQPAPQFFEISKNPNSAGRYALGRKFTVGDEFGIFVYDDLLTKVGKRKTLQVTKVDWAADRVELNNGEYIWDTMGNVVKEPAYSFTEMPRQFHPAELQVGKKWTASWKNLNNGFWGTGRTSIVDLHVVAFEKVRVPAGEFMAFLITFEGWDYGGRDNQHHYGRLWVVPGLNISIKREHDKRTNVPWGRGWSSGYELVSLRQYAADAAYATASAGSRGLVVRGL